VQAAKKIPKSPAPPASLTPSKKAAAITSPKAGMYGYRGYEVPQGANIKTVWQDSVIVLGVVTRVAVKKYKGISMKLSTGGTAFKVISQGYRARDREIGRATTGERCRVRDKER